MTTLRTCDRCYKIKSRCVWTSGDSICARCARLGHTCETKRDILQPGRPRTAQKTGKSPSKELPSHSNNLETSSPPCLVREAQLSHWTKGFQQHEAYLVEFILHPNQIGKLLYGETFQCHLRSAIAGQLFSATEQLKDGFLVFAKALLDQKKHASGELDLVSASSTGSRSNALRKLSALPITSIENARIALALALMLVTYNDLCVGTTTLPVSRSALLHVVPWRHRLIGSTTEDTDSNLICILFVELFECIVFGMVPIFRFEPPLDDVIVDRYYGISHGLLRYLYDISVLYSLIKTQSLSGKLRELYINSLANAVDQWDPEAELDRRRWLIHDKFEEQHFLLQGRAYKAAAQLLLLQAQLPGEGNWLARSKAAELEAQVLEIMQHGVDRPKYLLFPYFVACIELYVMTTDVQLKVLRNMNEISNHLAPSACQSMLGCLIHISDNRRKRPGLSWFECIDERLLFGMGP